MKKKERNRIFSDAVAEEEKATGVTEKEAQRVVKARLEEACKEDVEKGIDNPFYDYVPWGDDEEGRSSSHFESPNVPSNN